MPAGSQSSDGMGWLAFSLMTVACWGLYGAFLHGGAMGMKDPANGRYKAFFLVGIAYFVTAVIAPAVMLKLGGAEWKFPGPGLKWSLLAGLVGAAGAFCVLLAFGAKGQPAVVMSIIFAGAPVVNAIYVMALHPPEGGVGSVDKRFFLGILLAAVGGCLVTLYKPDPPRAPAAVQAVPGEAKPANP